MGPTQQCRLSGGLGVLITFRTAPLAVETVTTTAVIIACSPLSSHLSRRLEKTPSHRPGTSGAGAVIYLPPPPLLSGMLLGCSEYNDCAAEQHAAEQQRRWRRWQTTQTCAAAGPM